VVPILMPPLRDRPEDIPLLAHHFLQEFGRENGKEVTGFAPEAMESLLNHCWPGNVRELRTAIEHAVVLARGSQITARDLPLTVRAQSDPMVPAGRSPFLPRAP
jgi:DNA-binding NtrC family response regulator